MTRKIAPLGQVIRATDLSGIETPLTYNELGLPVSSSTPQITSIKDAVGAEIVGYELDELMRPRLVKSGKFSIGIEFDSLGRKKQISYPNKLETTFSFDNLDRLAEINTPDLGFRSYDYDPLSNISQIKYESGQMDYAYDRNSSLIGAYYRGAERPQDELFVWDVSGNRLNGTKAPANDNLRPRPIVINNGLFEDAEPLGEETVGRYSMIYDMHGNVTKKFDNQENIYYVFEYDADNKIVYAEKYKNDSLLLKARYTFDGLGRRIEKEVTKGSTVTRKSYIYNGDNILLEYNSSDSTPVETARYIGTGEIDDNLMVIKNGKAYFYHKDHLGSIVAITNNVGEMVQKNQYSSFGKILSIKNKERKEIGIEGAIEKSFAYTGREWDEEIDLYYYRARHYDPQAGRFVQKDPIGLSAGDANIYRYVKNNSLRYRDPLGLNPGDIFKTESEAALDALKYINPRSIIENIEYSGTIERDVITGGYYATYPVGGNADTSPFNPTSFSTASYHTHAAYSPIHDNENFSQPDIIGDREFNLNSYVSTPSGNIKFRTTTSQQDFFSNTPNACTGGR